MGAWYRVIKIIKGHRYVYEQRTQRNGKHVRTENRYVGPAAGGRAAGEPTPVTTTPRVLYHGSRKGIEGELRASEEGTFGPGLYLTTAKRAERYATFTAKAAANPDNDGSDEPRFDGMVYAADVGSLKLKAMSWDDFLDQSEALDRDGAATQKAKAKLQELLAAEGYDGVEIRDTIRPEVVIFPIALPKLKLQPVTTTEGLVAGINPRFIKCLDSVLSRSVFGYDELTNLSDDEIERAQEIAANLGMGIVFDYDSEGALLIFKDAEKVDIHFAQAVFELLLQVNAAIPLIKKPDGTVILYHRTSRMKALSIIKNGLEHIDYLTASGPNAISEVVGTSHYGDMIFEVTINPRWLGYNGFSEFRINDISAIKAIHLQGS